MVFSGIHWGSWNISFQGRGHDCADYCFFDIVRVPIALWLLQGQSHLLSLFSSRLRNLQEQAPQVFTYRDGRSVAEARWGSRVQRQLQVFRGCLGLASGPHNRPASTLPAGPQSWAPLSVGGACRPPARMLRAQLQPAHSFCILRSEGRP